jgi:hypothetical protein
MVVVVLWAKYFYKTAMQPKILSSAFNRFKYEVHLEELMFKINFISQESKTRLLYKDQLSRNAV